MRRSSEGLNGETGKGSRILIDWELIFIISVKIKMQPWKQKKNKNATFDNKVQFCKRVPELVQDLKRFLSI